MQNNADLVQNYGVDELPPGEILLHGQYTIEKYLIDGGFSMTYLARDSLDRRVVIKECFPSAFCRRVNGEVRPHKANLKERYQKILRSVKREALRLAKLEHPSIVKVHQVFEENNTVYIAMDYVEGLDLITILDTDPDRLTSALVEKLLRDTLSALDYVHKAGILHRDISPDNLLLDAKDRLTMIDFGAAREDAAMQTRALSVVMSVKDGYSPHEFYYTDGEQRPSSDIYSVGATFYQLITGDAPPDCQNRVAALSTDNPDPYVPLTGGDWPYDPEFLEAIDKSLSIPQHERFQSALEWMELLDSQAAQTAKRADMPEQATEEPVSEPVDIDPRLAAEISSLVRYTNSRLEPAEPVEAPKATDAEQDATGKSQTRLVDIFGNPIEDVDAWLLEQDRLSKRRQKAAQNNAEDAWNASGSGFGLSRLLSKITRTRMRRSAQITAGKEA